MIEYQRRKPPEAEPAKLAHNDYLQQGSDSGVVGLCSYLVLVAGSLLVLYRRLRSNQQWDLFAIWLGVVGLAVQEMVEFSLYIPALAWPFFLFLGWLWSASISTPFAESRKKISRPGGGDRPGDSKGAGRSR